MSHLQRAWDVPVVSASYDQILSTVPSASDKARLLAVACKEAGAWLYALPIPSAGLKLEDNMVRVGVGLHLGTPLCVPHSCSGCNATVDESGHHGLSCHFSKDRHFQHSSVNDVIKRTLSTLGVPCHLEPSGISRLDGKRPDGLTLAPWKNGKALLWDFTCLDTLAPSYLTMSTIY